jgi:hypothetical protein
VYTTEHPILVERKSVSIERPPPVEQAPTTVPATLSAPPSQPSSPSVALVVLERTRDEEGHCWDGLACDHADHGPAGGPIHLIR